MFDTHLTSAVNDVYMYVLKRAVGSLHHSSSSTSSSSSCSSSSTGSSCVLM